MNQEILEKLLTEGKSALDNKASIIIPTILKVEKIFFKLLDTILPSDFVKEVIVINNSNKKFTYKSDFSDKIVLIEDDNYWVNGAWNKGAEIATTENLIFLNDDVLIHADVIEDIVKELNNYEFSLIGADHDCIQHIDTQFVIKNNEIERRKSYFVARENMTFEFGILMAIKKYNYIKIPDELKVYYGDNFLFYFTRMRSGLPCALINTKIYHKLSSSSKQFTKNNQEKVDAEEEFWTKLTFLFSKKIVEYEESKKPKILTL